MLKGRGYRPGGRIRTVAALLATWLGTIALAAHALDPSEAKTTALSFGAFPSHSLVSMEAFYAPLALYLSNAIGRSVRFGTSSSPERFRERLSRREFDVAFVQASDYASYAYPLGYRPLARPAAAALVVFVRLDSPVRSIEDLRGKSIALPPLEDDATMVAVQHLRSMGLEPGRDLTVEYLPQNNACLQYVLSGRSAAGVASEDALHFAGAQRNLDYRVLDAGATVAAPVFIVSPRLSANERDRIRDALLRWSSDAAKQGNPITTGWMKLTPASDADMVVTTGTRVPVNDAAAAALPSPTAKAATKRASGRTGRPR